MLVLFALVAAGSVTGVDMAQAQSCLGKREIQEAIASGEILNLAQVMARSNVGAREVLSVQVCDQNGTLVYIIAVIDNSGTAENLVLNAKTGRQ